MQDKLSGHIKETDKKFDKITQELNARTSTLASDFTTHVGQTATAIQPARQEFNQVKRHVNTNEAKILSDRLEDKILAIRQLSKAEFIKMNQAIEKLRSSLSSNQLIRT